MNKMINNGKTSYFGAILLLASATTGLAADAKPDVPPGDAESVERGRYIVQTSGCHDCHTPWILGANGPEPDMSRMLSGHPESESIPATAALPAPWVAAISPTNTAWSGEWGVSFTANLTPDDETGMGKWSYAMFRDAIRTGRHKGRGRPILPPMPVAMYKHFTDTDLEAIFAYLQSIPEISNRVPEPLPPQGIAASKD